MDKKLLTVDLQAVLQNAEDKNFYKDIENNKNLYNNIENNKNLKDECFIDITQAAKMNIVISKVSKMKLTSNRITKQNSKNTDKEENVIEPAKRGKVSIIYILSHIWCSLRP
jgi:hypothetical protein